MEKVLFTGQQVQASLQPDGIGRVRFDNQTASVNKFNVATLSDLQSCMDALEKEPSLRGVLFSSTKSVFIVGADIMEFIPRFKTADSELTSWLASTHTLFDRIEDLPCPTVAAINGVCLGGGCEVTLACTFRLATDQASIGLPETKLGIFPGWGGTVRLPRMIGADNAIEWIAGGKAYTAAEALQIGVIDGIVAAADLENEGLALLARAAKEEVAWQPRQAVKKRPLSFLTPLEAVMAFESAKAFVGAQAGPHYPAPMEAIEVMRKSAGLSRKEAQVLEIAGFVKVAKTKVAESLVSIFLADQFNKKQSKQWVQKSTPVKRAGVLGAGIMGGGIAYQSASRGVPILMKDIAPAALELGLKEAAGLLDKQVERKKIDTKTMAKVMASITPTLQNAEFASVDVVVEAVVENLQIKQKVLAEIEKTVSPTTILASNTSTIPISLLAQSLVRPENFCGMHFFNPVHRMPLVEVIRGEKTSDEAIARITQYTLQMGKTPIVVKDCPGFLVNRILFPYCFAFLQLVEEGVDFVRIDRVMEKFGWPMGPAYLLDVIGLDTVLHAAKVMLEAYPQRMQIAGSNPVMHLVEAKRLGQKNGKGFYRYEVDRKGKSVKKPDPEVIALLGAPKKECADADIIDRLMIPMINESAWCIEEKIVSSPMELDLGLLYGLGFPPFRGGALKYADDYGLEALCKKADSFAHLGGCYQPAPLLRKMAQSGALFYHA